MNGHEVHQLRERMGWSQDQLGEMLKASLGRGSSTTVGKWEKGVRPVPEDVALFLAQVELEKAFPERGDPAAETPLESEASSSRGGSGDSAPSEPGGLAGAGAPSGEAGQLPLPGGGSYARVCEELWELVATGVGMVGAVTGSQALRKDGEILTADKEALGRAYGKLAESNATFRRMLLSATGGGAWLEVALVSGITFGKCYRSHQEIGRQAAELAQLAAGEEVADYGDGIASFPVEAAAA